MSDVFISYSKSDREAAERVATALAAQGLAVWWDREIAFGESFDRVIERELAQAEAVIVLWSRSAVESDWVRNEARRGLSRRVLIPARIDDVDIPLEFSNVQFADLAGWHPAQPHEAFDRLVGRVRQVVQGSPPQPAAARAASSRAVPSAASPSAEKPQRPGSAGKLLGGLAATLLMGAIGFWFFSPDDRKPVPNTAVESPAGAASAIAPLRDLFPAEIARPGLAASTSQAGPLAPSSAAASANATPAAAATIGPASAPRPARQTVPDVVGLRLAVALERVRAAGLQPLPQLAPNRDQAADTVYASGPPAASLVTTGDRVWLYHTAPLVCAATAAPAQLSVPMQANGAAFEGRCYYLANGGDSCAAFCARTDRSCDLEGLKVAAQSLGACKAVVATLGGTGGLPYSRSSQYSDDLSGCTYADWGKPEDRWVQLMRKDNGDPRCDTVNADRARMRVCACKR